VAASIGTRQRVDASARTRQHFGMKGTVAAFEHSRGVGLITPAEGGARVGFRIEDVEVAKAIKLGEEVIYTVEVGDWYANRVRVLGGPRSNRSRKVAAALALFGGLFGMQKFYLGYPWAGVALFFCTFVLWGLVLPVVFALGLGIVEFFIYLGLSDDEFENRYLLNRRAWL